MFNNINNAGGSTPTAQTACPTTATSKNMDQTPSVEELVYTVTNMSPTLSPAKV